MASGHMVADHLIESYFSCVVSKKPEQGRLKMKENEQKEYKL